MNYDLLIIGAGPGGYVSAIRAAQLGMKVAIAEKRSGLGGTCLNVGCIPSKTLLDSSEHFFFIAKEAKMHGINVKGASFDWSKMLERKNGVVDSTGKGIEFLMKKNKIDVLRGAASFTGPGTVQILKEDGESQEVISKNVIIATGSEPSDLPSLRFDGKRIISSTEALSLPSVPKKLAVVGAGVIGLELGSVYARLGTEVTVIEYLDRCLPTMDAEVSKEMQRVLAKQGLKFFLSHEVKGTSKKGGVFSVLATGKNGEVSFEADVCLVAVGRRPFTKGLGLEKAGVELDQRGFIKTDAKLQTTASNVFAIGDVVGQPMLAHKAEEEGVFVVETIAGQKPHINYDCIPGIVYTWPEASSVGATEEELKSAGRKIKTGKFPFRALGRAKASDELDGFVKVIADADTDRVLGVHIVGARASDLIMEAVVAMEYKASAEDIARICHGHPTYTESLKEAALIATENRAIHL